MRAIGFSFASALLVGSIAVVNCVQAQEVVRADYLKQPDVQRLRTTPIIEATAVCDGFAIAANSVRSPAVVGTIDRIPTTGVFYDLDYVESYEALSRLLTVSASASFGVPAVGVSARVSLLREAKISKTSVYVLVRMTVLTRKESFKDLALRETALPDATPENLHNRFYPRYGDAFVSAIVFGGELAALMEFKSTNGMSMENLRATITGRLPIVKVDGDFQSQIVALTKELSVRVKYAESGGSLSAKGILAMDSKTLIERVGVFPIELKSNPDSARGLFAELKEYSAVGNVPVDGAISPGSASSSLESIAGAELLLREEIATADEVLSAPAAFGTALLNAASARKAYGEYARKKVQRAFDVEAAHPLENRQSLLESYPQYRIERRFKLPSDMQRLNVEGICDLKESDSDRLRECLFGPLGSLSVEAWPKEKSKKSTRVIIGDSYENLVKRKLGFKDGLLIRLPNVPPDWYGGSTVIGCVNPTAWAEAWCGKTRADDGIFVSINSMDTVLNDGACGYHSTNVTCIAFESPQRPIIPALAEIRIGQLMKGPPASETTSTVEPGGFILELSGLKASCTPSAGKYIVSARVRSESGLKKVAEASYWRRTHEGDFVIRHSIPRASDNDVLEQPRIELAEVVCD